MLDPAGALFWPAESMLVVSDLHLEKGSAAARRGQLLPPWDTRTTLDRLAALLRRWQPRTLLALGDSFHDSEGPARLDSGDSGRLVEFSRSTRILWLLGNHDPTIGDSAALPGEPTGEFACRRILFRHQAAPVAAGQAEISGHFHPKASVATRAGSVSRPCFVADARRLLMPAFGAYTGGLDVAAPPIGRLFPRGGRVFLLGRERLFSFALPAGRRPARAAPEPAQLAIDP